MPVEIMRFLDQIKNLRTANHYQTSSSWATKAPQREPRLSGPHSLRGRTGRPVVGSCETGGNSVPCVGLNTLSKVNAKKTSGVPGLPSKNN